jgi:hypothetical protein
MRAATAYFVGAGTIIAAIAIGLGGGIVAGNIMNPISPKQGPDTSRLEQRAQPVVATVAPSEHVPYLAGSQAMVEALGAPAQAEPQNTAGSVAPAVPQRAAASDKKPDEAVGNEVKSANAQPTEPAKPVEKQVSTEPRAAPENAYAKASDADAKRAASDQRRAERRKSWAERRRNEMRGSRERTDWNDVARSVREDSESRDWASGPRSGLPQFRLFGADDD